MMSLSASTTALSTQRFVFGNGRVRSGAAASSRNVVGASKTTVTRRARANWARTVSAVGNGIEPSRSTGAARDPKRDSKRGGSMGINAVAVRIVLPSIPIANRDRCVARPAHATTRTPPIPSIRSTLSERHSRDTSHRTVAFSLFGAQFFFKLRRLCTCAH